MYVIRRKSDGLFSDGNSYQPTWVSLDKARTFRSVGALRNHETELWKREVDGCSYTVVGPRNKSRQLASCYQGCEIVKIKITLEESLPFYSPS